jgi:23S rRNA pseudouridine2605 synthase
MEDLRLQVRMARAGVASRRECERLIAEGRVSVDGVVVRQLGTKVNAHHVVVVDGQPLPEERKLAARYFALHKPRGYLCANADARGRPLAIDLLPSLDSGVRLFHVGRLDMWSEGLILFTSDGDFALRATHPRYEVEKEYRVQVDHIDRRHLDSYLGDAAPEGLRIKSYRLVAADSAQVTLAEGKNREIRRIFNAGGMRVVMLRRERIGPIHLEALERGRYRKLSAAEVAWFVGR